MFEEEGIIEVQKYFTKTIYKLDIYNIDYLHKFDLSQNVTFSSQPAAKKSIDFTKQNLKPSSFGDEQWLL